MLEHRLTSELDHWRVVLTDGSVVRVMAHAHHEDGDDVVFVALMVGTPHYEQELVRFPKSTALDVEGGWAEPR